MRACRKYWLIAVSSFLRILLRCPTTSTSPFMGGSLGRIGWIGAADLAAVRLGCLSRARGGIGGRPLAEHLACAGFTRAAARRNAGTGLQLLERPGAVEDRLLQAFFGDSVAKADVHGAMTSSGIVAI